MSRRPGRSADLSPQIWSRDESLRSLVGLIRLADPQGVEYSLSRHGRGLGLGPLRALDERPVLGWLEAHHDPTRAA